MCVNNILNQFFHTRIYSTDPQRFICPIDDASLFLRLLGQNLTRKRYSVSFRLRQTPLHEGRRWQWMRDMSNCSRRASTIHSSSHAQVGTSVLFSSLPSRFFSWARDYELFPALILPVALTSKFKTSSLTRMEQHRYLRLFFVMAFWRQLDMYTLFPVSRRGK